MYQITCQWFEEIFSIRKKPSATGNSRTMTWIYNRDGFHLPNNWFALIQWLWTILIREAVISTPAGYEPHAPRNLYTSVFMKELLSPKHLPRVRVNCYGYQHVLLLTSKNSAEAPGCLHRRSDSIMTRLERRIESCDHADASRVKRKFQLEVAWRTANRCKPGIFHSVHYCPQTFNLQVGPVWKEKLQFWRWLMY